METMTYVEIDLKKFEKNIESVRKSIGRYTKICAMLKADAYGHGAIRLAEKCQTIGIDYIGVATPFEGAKLRNAGIRLPVLVFDAVLPEHISSIIDYNLTATVFDLQIIEKLQIEAEKKGLKIPVHIQYDTGFSRVGVKEEELHEALQLLKKCDNVDFIGFYSHFIDAGSKGKSISKIQIKKFRKGVECVKAMGYDPIVHISNSAGIMHIGDCEFDMVRPGIMLYGCYPSEYVERKIELFPVLQWKTNIVQIKNVPAGTGVGYESTFITKRSTRIGTLPVGYADGYNRMLSNNAFVLVKGIRAPIIGRISMDLSMVDITDIGGVETGDEVVLLGNQGAQSISADELAARSQTISYEILTSISPRVRRIYLDY